MSIIDRGGGRGGGRGKQMFWFSLVGFLTRQNRFPYCDRLLSTTHYNLILASHPCRLYLSPPTLYLGYYLVITGGWELTWTRLQFAPSLEENFGILEGGAGDTARSEDWRLESIDPLAGPPLRARLIAFSSSTRKAPTGILEGVTGLKSASFSFFLTQK